MARTRSASSIKLNFAYLPDQVERLRISGDDLHPRSTVVVYEIADQQLMTIVFERNEHLDEHHGVVRHAIPSAITYSCDIVWTDLFHLFEQGAQMS